MPKTINLADKIEFLTFITSYVFIQQQEINGVDNNNKISIEDNIDRIMINHKKRENYSYI